MPVEEWLAGGDGAAAHGRGVGRLPVLDGDRLAGVIRRDAVLRAFALRDLGERPAP